MYCKMDRLYTIKKKPSSKVNRLQSIVDSLLSLLIIERLLNK